MMGGNTHLRNVVKCLADYRAKHSRTSSYENLKFHLNTTLIASVQYKRNTKQPQETQIMHMRLLKYTEARSLKHVPCTWNGKRIPYLQEAWKVYFRHPITDRELRRVSVCPRTIGIFSLPDIDFLVTVCVLRTNTHTRKGNSHFSPRSLSHGAVNFT
jgi:hypothetical protein